MSSTPKKDVKKKSSSASSSKEKTKAPLSTNNSKPTPALGSEQPLRSESEIQQMQNDATSGPATSPTSVPETSEQATERMIREELEAQSKASAELNVNTLNATLVISLDLTDDFLENSAADLKTLSDFDNAESEKDEPKLYNLFNPFKGLSKQDKAKNKTITRGIVRNAMKEILEIANEINNKQVVYLGSKPNRLGEAKKFAEAVKARIEQALELAPSTEIVSLNVENVSGEIETQVLRFKDLIKVNTWTNIGDGGWTSNVFFNLVVKSPALYSSKEPIKALEAISGFINGVVESNKDGDHTVILALNLRPNAVTDEAKAELISYLNESDEWAGYDRYDLHKMVGSDSGWVPDSKTQVNEALLPTCGDLLYVRFIPDSEEEGDAEGDE